MRWTTKSLKLMGCNDLVSIVQTKQESILQSLVSSHVSSAVLPVLQLIHQSLDQLIKDPKWRKPNRKVFRIRRDTFYSFSSNNFRADFS